MWKRHLEVQNKPIQLCFPQQTDCRCHFECLSLNDICLQDWPRKLSCLLKQIGFLLSLSPLIFTQSEHSLGATFSPILESIGTGYKSSNKWNNKSLLSESVQYSISSVLHESWRRTESEKEICGTIIITDNGTVFALKSQLIISDTFSIWILCIVVLLVTGTFFLGWSTSLELRFFHMKEEEAAPQVSISGCDFQGLIAQKSH
jgi:hypothetical protein